MPSTIGGRIALRADEDPLRPTSGCPGGLAFVAGIAFRCGSFAGRLAPGAALAAGTGGGFEIGFFRRIFVGRAALFNTGQCSSLYYLRAM